MRFFNYSLIVFVLFFTSCTGEKIITNNYLYNIPDSTGKLMVSMPQPVIHQNDLLYIKVFSMSTKPETDLPYNLPDQNTIMTTNISPTSGFLVDNNGNIEYPRLGVLHVEGLTRQQLADVIKKRLETELTSPSVIVRFLNYKITVLGEVRTPGTFTAPTERITILDALGLAGDVSEYGSKTSVKIARETGDQIEIGQVDLTSNNLFSSPYFRLQQNDVVFVEQTRRKVRQQEQQNVTQQIGIATGLITTLALLLNFFTR